MSICPHCGAVNEKDARFCTACGKPLSAPAQSSSTGAGSKAGAARQTGSVAAGQTRPASTMSGSSTSTLSGNPTSATSASSASAPSSATHFVDEDEKEIMRLSPLTLTDRRLYYSGEAIEDKHKEKIAQTIDVENITATGYRFLAKTSWLIWGIVLLALSFLNFLMAVSTIGDLDNIVGIFIFLFIIIGIALIIAYFVNRKRYYSVTYPGGSLTIDASTYLDSNIEAFDRCVHKATAQRKAELLRRS